MNDDKIFFQVQWIAPTDFWVTKSELTYISTEVMLDLLEDEREAEFEIARCCFILEGVNTYCGKQSLYIEYEYHCGTTLINVTDFEFFEPNDISDAILDKLNAMRKLAE